MPLDEQLHWRFYSCLWESVHCGGRTKGGSVQTSHPVLPNWPFAGGSEHSQSRMHELGRALETFYSDLRPYTGADSTLEANVRAEHSSFFRDGRMTGLILVVPEKSSWRIYDFRVEGSRALKGARKRDGPLYRFDLENSREQLGDVAKDAKTPTGE